MEFQAARYLRLLGALARYGLIREMAFRWNFLVKAAVELLWLFLLIIFYRTIFLRTSVVAGWTEAEYLFFVGCHFALSGFIETFFMENCSQFAELVRTGDLDFYLVKPIDEQFLISCKNIEWSTFPNVLLGFGIMVVGLVQTGWTFDLIQAAVFLVLFVCGVALSYSFLLMLASTSIWLVRNQSLYEMWWLFSTMMRYPRGIFNGPWAGPFGWFFTFIIPVTVVVSVPAETMVKVFDPRLAVFMTAATVVMLWVSRRYFRRALSRYRSASS